MGRSCFGILKLIRWCGLKNLQELSEVTCLTTKSALHRAGKSAKTFTLRQTIPLISRILLHHRNVLLTQLADKDLVSLCAGGTRERRDPDC